MNERKTIEISVTQKERDNGDTENLIEFISQLQGELDSIPSEYQSTAKIKFLGGIRYEDGYVDFEITYSRSETDEEMANRLKRESFDSEWRKERELKMLAELKAKYEQ